MANDWTKNPISIDTAEDKSTAGNYNVKYFEWHPNAEDNDIEIQDGNGGVLWKVRAQFAAPNHEASNILYRQVDRRDVDGLNIITIDGGTLYIHISTRNVDQR